MVYFSFETRLKLYLYVTLLKNLTIKNDSKNNRSCFVEIVGWIIIISISEVTAWSSIAPWLLRAIDFMSGRGWIRRAPTSVTNSPVLIADVMIPLCQWGRTLGQWRAGKLPDEFHLKIIRVYPPGIAEWGKLWLNVSWPWVMGMVPFC